MNFLDTKISKNLLLFDIIDVDEFVLSECKSTSNTNELFDKLRQAKRLCAEYCFGEQKFEEYEISLKDFRIMEEDGAPVVTRLNYEVFQDAFFDFFEPSQYYNEWLYENHYNKDFLPSTINWIKDTGGDSLSKLRLINVLGALKQSNKSLKKIKETEYLNESENLNEIQKTIIDVFINFTKVMLGGLNDHFIRVFGDLLSENEKPKKHKKNISPKEKTGFRLNEGHKTSGDIITKLIKGNFIDKTTITTLRTSFSVIGNQKIEKQIEWKGSVNSLNYFIKQLLSKSIIPKDEHQAHWHKTRNVFTKSTNDLSNLAGNNKLPPKKQKEKLDEIVSLF